MTQGYRILDEPTPSKISHLSVQPLWPLLAVMFGGTWAAWPWFALNGFAMGSPTRVKELLWSIGGFVGTFLLTLGIFTAYSQEWVSEVGFRYLIVALSVWKLLVSYWLYVLQSRTFAIYQHFGGMVRNGLLVVFVLSLLRPRVINALPGIMQILFS